MTDTSLCSSPLAPLLFPSPPATSPRHLPPMRCDRRSVVRGHFKQSISAFRLAAVTSLLAVIVQWPAIVGALQAFQQADLWWWSPFQTVPATFPAPKTFPPLPFPSLFPQQHATLDARSRHSCSPPRALLSLSISPFPSPPPLPFLPLSCYP